MAPIVVSSTGMPRQVIDDPELRLFLQRLNYLAHRRKETAPLVVSNINAGSILPVDMDALITELQRCPKWRFQEQADLYEWIAPLDLIDSALRQIIQTHPHLLLVEPPPQAFKLHAAKPVISPDSVAQSVHDVDSVPQTVVLATRTILQFLTSFLRNSLNKSVFNSVGELVALLAAADDTIADLALQALSSLSIPPLLSRQQTPEINQHSTALHTAIPQSGVHARLMELARGWGTKGTDLGLVDCVVADDSIHGQEALPQYPGHFIYEFYSDPKPSKAVPEEFPPSRPTEPVAHTPEDLDRRMISIQLSDKEILRYPVSAVSEFSTHIIQDSKQVEKRRRMGSHVDDSEMSRRAARETKSTAELFFAAVSKAGGRSNIPSDRVFPLLALLRLAKSFHSQAGRIAAVERRLYALITVLNGQPSQDILLGYFHAQPELCTEIVDIIKPIIASSTVPSNASIPGSSAGPAVAGNSGLLALADSSHVPHRVRTLAVECLTALVARRESNNGGTLSGLAKLANVFNELGIGKSQFLGFLPTLVRFSLATLNSFLLVSEKDDSLANGELNTGGMNLDDEIGFQLGRVFLQVSKPALSHPYEKTEQALEFIDAVLTLTSAVASVSTGALSLTECGVIPALLNTIALESTWIDKGGMGSSSSDHSTYVESMLTFIVAQVVQILEVTVAIHANALAVFYDLKGVDLLVNRISLEVNKIRKPGTGHNDNVHGIDVEMSDATEIAEKYSSIRSKLKASTRSLLFSLVNCLTVVFHQQDHMSASNPSRPPGSRHLQNVAFSESILDIFENADSYGGVLAALTCTLVSDIINTDPPVMHFVISSGLADAILFMITGRRDPPTSNNTEPRLPPSSELILAISSMLSTFSITSDGEEKLLKHNPFPEFLGIFLCCTYSMPDSRCLSSDIASIVGTALEDMIRNHSSFRTVIIHEVISCLRRLVVIGSRLVNDEISTNESSDVDRSRTLFIQYAYHFSQIIEQLLSSNEETLKLFEQFGGVEQILSLYPSLIPHGRRFLAHISTHSAVSLAILTQSQTVTSFTVAIDSSSVAALNEKLISKILSYLEKHLNDLQSDIFSLRLLTNSSRFTTVPELIVKLGPYISLDISGSLENLPMKPIHLLQHDSSDDAVIQNLSSFLRQLLVVEWLTDCLASKLKSHKKWFHDSALFVRLQEQFRRLSMLHRTSIYELCRVRTAPMFEERESKRWNKSNNECHPSIYTLRIVCPEGAVVRDGIDIDSSLHVGGLEMGETIIAYDRCINSSGVMRYRTANGWVSEQTRGHGRELIAEVFAVEGLRTCTALNAENEQVNRIDCGIPDLAIVSSSILARLQSCYAGLCSSLARTAQGTSPSSSSVEASILQLLAETLQTSFKYGRSGCVSTCISMEDDGVVMYMGYVVTLLNACLFEERRDRIQTLNVLLLARLLFDDGFHFGIILSDKKDDLQSDVPESGFFGAVRFIFKNSLLQMSTVQKSESDPVERRFSRSVAASFPTVVATLQKLVSKCTHAETSAWTSAVKKLTEKQMRDIFVLDGAVGSRVSFDSVLFAKGVGKVVGDLLSELLVDVRFASIPSHMLHPILSLVKNIIGYLEEYSESSSDITATSTIRPSDDSTRRRLSALSSFFGDTSAAGRNFQPSEVTINRLVEMGFSRELSREAVERCRSNNLEIATEWALSHFPDAMPSPLSNGNRGAMNRFDTTTRTNAGIIALNGSNTDTNVDANQVSLARNRVSSLDPSQARRSLSSSEDPSVNKTEDRVDTRSEPDLQDCIKMLKKGVIDAALFSIEHRLFSDSSSSLRDFDSVTTVACSFLLDFCDRYPSKRSEIVVELMRRLISVFKYDEKGSNCQVLDGNDTIFASLCHAAVLVLRALPSARPLALRFNVVSSLTQCIRGHASKLRCDDSVIEKSPLWLSPALLLLEIMSQPVSIELEDEDVTGTDFAPVMHSATKRRNDYTRVYSEHKKRRGAFSKYMKRLFTFANEKVLVSAKKKKRSKPKSDTVISKEESCGADNVNEGLDIDDSPPFPMFLSLMTTESAEACAVICVSILRGRQRKNSEVDVSTSSLHSDVTHATLLLLISVLRSFRIASLFLNMGGVELLLSLQSDSRFEGHSSLVTVAFCRILEDENTLQAAMESEIKSTLIKLHKKQNTASHHKPSVPSSAFFQVMTPLIHRDHMIFLKSMFVSIKVESLSSTDGTSLPQYRVVLLTPEERSANIKFITEPSKNLNASLPPTTDCGLAGASHVEFAENSNQILSPSTKSKLPSDLDLKPPSVPQKGQKKDKASINDPMGHISLLLLTDMIMKGENKFALKSQFLNQHEILDIIADLVLSIPGFSNAIHNYNPPNMRLYESAKAALRNSTLNPSSSTFSSSNVIKYILNRLLPQPEVMDTGGATNNDSSSKQNNETSPGLKLSQSSARLLVSLVARPGESRWYVITELASALFDLSSDDVTPTKQELKSSSFDSRMWTLKAWGDLCMGIVSLRSIGASSDKDSSSLNSEIAGIMYEAGVPYGIFHALKFMDLHHPMASIVAAALLRPLEVFTRCSVIEAVKEMRVVGMNKISKKPTAQTLALSQVDTMAFEDSDRPLSMVADSSSDGENQDDSEVSSDEDDNSSEMESMDDEDMDEDDDEQEEEEEEEEHEDSSDGESSSHNHGESVGDEGDDEHRGVEGSSSSESESDDIDLNDDFNGNAPVWNEETDDYLDEEDEDDPDEIAGSEGNDGWTRIDNNHGGILDLLTSRGGIRALSRNRDMSMPGGEFLEHAAEAIGSILRDSNLELEAFERLGVRISRVPVRNRQETSTGAMLDDTARRNSQQQGMNEHLDRFSRGPTGSYPSVNQRSPPDMGFSSTNISGRLIDVNFAEYLFSTAMHGDAARTFYLPSTSCVSSEMRSTSHSLQTIEGSQLFPGGRSQVSLHPLLSGVNLPPSNSLVTSVGNRQLQVSQPDRDVGWSGILSSNSQGGNLIPIRVNRVPVSQSSTRNGLIGLRGWYDEATNQSRSAANDFAGNYDRALCGMVSLLTNRLAINEENTAGNNNVAVNDETGPTVPHDDYDDQTQSTRLIDANLENQGTEVMTDSLAAGLNLSSETSSTIENSGDGGVDERTANQMVDRAEAALSSSTVSEPGISVNRSGPSAEPISESLMCPPGIDDEVFRSLPVDMQLEVIASYRLESDDIPTTDNEPNPRNAEDMDNASFIASLSPDLRDEILRTADESFLNTLPPAIVAEAQLLRERANSRVASIPGGFISASMNGGLTAYSTIDGPFRILNRNITGSRSPTLPGEDGIGENMPQHNKQKMIGKVLVSADPDVGTLRLANDDVLQRHGSLLCSANVIALLRLTYLLSPVRPQRLLQKVFRNICEIGDIRRIITTALIGLLNDDELGTKMALSQLDMTVTSSSVGNEPFPILDFPPKKLLGADPRIEDESNDRLFLLRRRQSGDNSTAGAAIATYLPLSTRGSSSVNSLPSVVARRLIGCLHFVMKHIEKFPVDVLNGFNSVLIDGRNTILDALFGLLSKKAFYISNMILDEILSVLDIACAPLASLPSKDEKDDDSTKEKPIKTQEKKIWIDIPRPVVSPNCLQLLCSILRLESCKENSLLKVHMVVKNLCKVDENRIIILRELVTVARHLSLESIRDLKALSIRLDDAVRAHSDLSGVQLTDNSDNGPVASSGVALASSSNEMKLLRVLQTIQNLFSAQDNESSGNQYDASAVGELSKIFEGILLDSLWEQLGLCLRTVSALEGVRNSEKTEDLDDEELGDNLSGKKKVRNNVAGLMTRFLPIVEAFFVVHSASPPSPHCDDNSTSRGSDDMKTHTHENHSLHDPAAHSNKRLIEFVSSNKVLLNAILRNNQGLLDKGLRSMVQVPQCRNFLDFDVKRLWFKSQVKRLRQQANRRYGSLRLNIRRQNVFEDAYHQLRLRNADEMRGKLHVSFRHEEGVDAGGLSREFFSILAKEMFNPNYALFTSTEDGCTFQPNMHSSINPDHLSYFRFVGRIVGKAILDGYLLDAHFTRSLYKHMLGLKPTYHDMEAIDPDYYKNLQTVLDYNLEDIDLDLTFSTETHSFGRSQTIDLIPSGRNVKVNESNKKEYVDLICQHRMTTAIDKQIKAYLDGFHEMIKPDLISVFNARELEMLISGMPDIDVSDLKKNTDYDGYKSSDKEIQWFWNIMFSLSRSDKAAFVQFVTGSSKVPLGGFSQLQGMRGIQKFSIHKVVGTKGALMSAHTCFNLLDLPSYESEEEMKEKLLYAIHEGAEGFLFA